MQSALRGNIDGGIGGASAKVIFAIGADTKVGGVAVQAHLASRPEGVAGGGEGKILAQLEEIAVDADHRSRGLIKGLVGAVVELDRGVGEVGGGEKRAWPG